MIYKKRYLAKPTESIKREKEIEKERAREKEGRSACYIMSSIFIVKSLIPDIKKL